MLISAMLSQVFMVLWLISTTYSYRLNWSWIVCLHCSAAVDINTWSVHIHHRCTQFVTYSQTICFNCVFELYFHFIHPSFIIYIASTISYRTRLYFPLNVWKVFCIGNTRWQHMLYAVYLSNHFQWILYSDGQINYQAVKKDTD